MPDGDVFDRNVRRGWQSAARLIFTRKDDPLALRSVIRALAKDVKVRGCPGFDVAVEVVVDAIRSTDPELAREAAHRRLDHLRRREGSELSEVLVGACKSLLASPPEISRVVEDDLLPRVTIATHVLARIANAWICPAQLLCEIIEHGQVPFQTVHARREQMVADLVKAPETARLARQLLVDSAGRGVKIPRMPREKPSQADILVSALTD